MEQVPTPPEYKFDEHGLRFSAWFLKNEYPAVIDRELIQQAIYVDEGTYNSYTHSLLNHHLPDYITKKVYKALTTTSVGNVAFLALYSPSIHVRMQCKTFLRLMKEYHMANKNKKTLWQRIFGS